MTLRIDRCICTGRTFAELAAEAQADQLTLEQLAERTGCTRHCGQCRPYVRRMLATGQVVFHAILADTKR